MIQRCCRVMSVAVLFAVATRTSAQAEKIPEKSAVYPLSQEVHGSLRDAAADSDVLILGEIHGTQEVPAVAAALLTPLSQLGYQTLALEIPADQRKAILAWANGTTTVVPSFFAAPVEDGRGNIEVLTLIRTALSPPFRWQLICFDQSWEGIKTAVPSQTTTETEMVALSVKRDKTMASHLCDQYEKQKTKAKVLAICGNFHARTANAESDPLLKQLWPSFAAALKSQKPDWRLGSVNVVPHRGGYFNGGQVHQINSKAIERPEFKRLTDSAWNFQLDLPVATPATFLKPPSNAITDR